MNTQPTVTKMKQPNPEDFDYHEGHPYNEQTVIFLQRNIQGIFEGLLLIPSISFAFILGRLWKSIGLTMLRHDIDTNLSFTAYRVCILSVMVPLCLNWIHF